MQKGDVIPIHFEAHFQPVRRKFILRVRVGKDKPLTERMTISQFLRRFVKKDNIPLTVNGTEIIFQEDDGQAEKAVRNYLKAVAESYVKCAWGKGEAN